MKKINVLIVLLVIGSLIFSCDKANEIFKTLDKSKLAPPLGLRAEPQNQKVTLSWFASNYEDDFAGYYVFQAEGDYTWQTNDTTLSAAFAKVDSIPLFPPQDKEISRTISGLTNGVTYSFAVVAFTKDGDEISYPSNIVAAKPEVKVVTGKEKLSPPLGLHSVTGNGQIALFWYTSNYEENFQGYYIFKASGDLTGQTSDSSLSTNFTVVDSLPVITGYSDGLVSKTILNLTNGQTYSFAIVAYAFWGEQISYPSNIINDTPRPEITSITLKSSSTGQVSGDDSQAGFDFNTFAVVQVPATGYTSTNGADIVNEAFDPSPAGTNIRPWLSGMNGGGLQDLGYMTDLNGADMAPEIGYSEQGKSIAVLPGHVYAVKTGDNHYGKLIITNVGGTPDYAITFNAAFQMQTGNRNYKSLPFNWNDLLGIHY